MPYSVLLTTRNILNPNPQLGNFWATELVERERRGDCFGSIHCKSMKEGERSSEADQRNPLTGCECRMIHPANPGGRSLACVPPLRVRHPPAIMRRSLYKGGRVEVTRVF